MGTLYPTHDGSECILFPPCWICTSFISLRAVTKAIIIISVPQIHHCGVGPIPSPPSVPATLAKLKALPAYEVSKN